MTKNRDEKERRKLNKKLLKRTFESEMKDQKIQKYTTQYMSIGLAIGQEKDKRLAENMMKISRIQHLAGFTEIFIYCIDKNGEEKEYRVSEKAMNTEKFAVGDRVAEEKEGVLVSLESKSS